MAVFTVQVTKPTPESKLGISFSAEGGRVVLTKISESSLFASTALAVGQTILSINETSVAGMDVQAVLSVLQSIPKVVTIKAKATNLFHLTYEEKKIKIPDGEGGAFIKTKFEVNSDRSVVPPQLAELGVTTAKWTMIVDAYSNKLLPSMYESSQMDKRFLQEMTSFVGTQMGGGAIGFGAESRHEKKVFNMTYQASILADNCHLQAYNVLALANAMVNAHGILAQLTFSSTQVPKWSEKLQKEKNVALRPNGIEFVSLADYISEISSISTIFTMNSTGATTHKDRIASLTGAIETMKIAAASTNTVHDGINVSSDTLKVHKLLTSHMLVYTADETPDGKWVWSGLREIKNAGKVQENPNLMLPDGVATFYGNMNYEYNLEGETIVHDVISINPVILDIKPRPPSKSKNSGTYGVDWWNIYIPMKVLEKLYADVKNTTKYILGDEGVIKDPVQGLASVTINIRDLADSPTVTMVTPSTDSDGNETGEVDHEDMGTMVEIMEEGGENELLAGVGFFSVGVSIRGEAGGEPPAAGNVVKLSMKMKAFHALSVIDGGVRRISYYPGSKGLKYS